MVVAQYVALGRLLIFNNLHNWKYIPTAFHKHHHVRRLEAQQIKNMRLIRPPHPMFPFSVGCLSKIAKLYLFFYYYCAATDGTYLGSLN
jgi:hypothetical protein